MPIIAEQSYSRWLVHALTMVVIVVASTMGFVPSTRAQVPVYGDPRLDSLNARLARGGLAEADSGARVLLAQLDAKGGPDSTIARAIDIVIQSLYSRGEAGSPDDRKLAARAVRLKERAFGKTSTNVAVSVNHLGALAATGGDYATARPSFQRAVEIYEKRLGPDHFNVASSLMNLANVLGDMGEAPAAIRAYQRVQTIYEKRFGAESAQVGMVLMNIGSTEFDSRNFAAARDAHERALAVWEKVHGPDHPLVARALIGLGNAIAALGDPAQAQPHLARAVAILEKKFGSDNPWVAMGLTALATAQTLQGDYSAAAPELERALAINEKAFGPDHPYVARTANSLGALSNMMDDFDTARPLYARALTINEKAFGREHVNVARAQMNLAIALQTAGELDSARTLLQQALATDEKLLGPDNADVALILENLGSLHETLGDDAAARRTHERCLAIRDKTLGRDHALIAKSLDHLADIYARAGQIDSARTAAERSLAIRERALGSEHPEVAESLGRLAAMEAAQGDTAHALDHALEAERVTLHHVRLTSRALSERQALLYATRVSSGLDLALALAARGLDGGSRRRVLDALGHSRAAVLDEMAARHRAAGDTTQPRVAHAAADLALARTRLANLVVRGPGADDPAVYRKVVDQARVEKERAERAMASASTHFAEESARSGIGLEQVATRLPAGTALLSFALYEKIIPALRPKAGSASYVAFVLRSGEPDPVVVDLGAASEIDALVQRWKQAASGGSSGGTVMLSEPEYRDAGTALRVRVWDPLASALSGSRRVFVVPDGALHLLNLAALPAAEGGYLVERDPELHHLSAERDLVPVGGTPGQGMLAVGGPDFEASLHAPALASRDGSTAVAAVAAVAGPSTTIYRGARSSCGDLAGVQFQPLADASVETREISGLWRRHAARGASRQDAVLDLQEAAATEAAFKRAAPGRLVLHVATHGFFLGRACGSAAGGRGIGGLTDAPAVAATSSVAAPTRSVESPLLRAGLVLAGANHRAEAGANEDDGILTAEEIASLPLSGVQWAVLSACETGVGDVRAGEGVLGLRRAFQVAGAGTSIMSLWSVDDRSTRAWMKALYQGRLEDHLDTAGAVTRASRDILRDRRAHRQSTHPFYWAAFVAAGDWH